VYGQAPVPSRLPLVTAVVTCVAVSPWRGGLRIGWLTVQNHELYDQLRLAKNSTRHLVRGTR
jgi:hypothetical protein